MTAEDGRTAAWAATLDELEDHTDRLEAALDAGELLEARPWAPPSGLGPLPDELRERALDLLTRVRDLDDEIRAARNDALGEVQRTRRRRDASLAYHAAG